MDPKTEIVEEAEPVAVVEEVDDKADILAAMDEAFDPVIEETETITDPKAEPEPEVKADAPETSEPEKDPDGKAEAEPAKDPEIKTDSKRPSDEFGELPENTKAETRQRFETLKSKYDESHLELERTKTAMEDHIRRSEEWADSIRSTGTNPEQFAESMRYLKSINSGTPEGLEEAYGIMQEGLKTLGQMLGKEAPGFDPLEAYADLKEEVEDGLITKERALEVAQSRSKSKLSSSVTSKQTEQQALESAKQDAYQGLVAVGNKLRANDPHYAGKQDQLKLITKLVVTSQKDPRLWPQMIEEAYGEIPTQAAAPASAPLIPNVPAPIRPGSAGSSGHLSKKPGNIMEAIEPAFLT